MLAYMVWAESVKLDRVALGSQGPDILKLISAKGYCSPVLELRLD